MTAASSMCITLFAVFILLSLSPTLASVVVPRYGQECVYLSPKIYCYGGRYERRDLSGRLGLASNLFNSLNLSESKDLSELQGSWELIPHETPGPNFDFAMVADPELKLIFMDGGLGPEDGNDLIRPTYNTTIYTVAEGKWSTDTQSGHMEVTDHIAILGLNNTVYVWGGYKIPLTSQWDNPVGHPLDMYTFNLRTLSWASITGVPSSSDLRIRHQGALGVDGVSIYYIGGVYPSSPKFENLTRYNYDGAPMNQVTIFDTSNHQWRTQNTTGLTPSTRSGHTFTLKPNTGEFILFGGYDPLAWPITRPDYFYLLDSGSLSWSNRTIGIDTGATQDTVQQIYDHSGMFLLLNPGSVARYHFGTQTIFVDNDLYIIFGNSENISSQLVRVLNTESWSWRASIDGVAHIDPTGVPEEPSKGSNSSTSSGVIAGAVVGTIAGVAIVSGVIFFLLRKRRQARATQYSKPNEFDAKAASFTASTPPNGLASSTDAAQFSTSDDTSATHTTLLHNRRPEKPDGSVGGSGIQRILLTPVKPSGT